MNSNRTTTKRQSQRAIVRSYLLSGERVCQSDAESWWGVKRLAARIKELRDEGLDISSHTRVVDGVRFVSYSLAAQVV